MLVQALKGLAVVAGGLGLVAGTLLLALSLDTLQGRGSLQHWLFEVNILGGLDKLHRIERPLYRHHRLTGTAFIGGSAVLMWLLYRLDMVHHIWSHAQHRLGQLGGRALALVSWMAALSALVIGIFLLVRPSAIKTFEAAANRWIEPIALHSQSGNGTLVRCALQSPRLVGLVLVTAGLGCLLALIPSIVA